jgi:hypothetical protein
MAIKRKRKKKKIPRAGVLLARKLHGDENIHKVDYTGPKAVFEGIELEYVPRPLRLFLVSAKKNTEKKEFR